MLGAPHPLADGQQRGELVAGPGRIPRRPGPVGDGDFRRVTAAAGLGAPWVPKELRTSFVSMMSYQGVPPDSKFVISSRRCARRPIEWARA
jgi:hypothetical protein